MAFKAVDPSAVWEYVSPRDPDPDRPTIWKLGPIDAFTWALVQDLAARGRLSDGELSDEADLSLALGTSRLEMVRHGLKGVENFEGAQFATRQVRRAGRTFEVVADSFLGAIPGTIIDELAARIETHNQLSEDQSKN
jgi:hypothetical protein